MKKHGISSTVREYKRLLESLAKPDSRGRVRAPGHVRAAMKPMLVEHVFIPRRQGRKPVIEA